MKKFFSLLLILLLSFSLMSTSAMAMPSIKWSSFFSKLAVSENKSLFTLITEKTESDENITTNIYKYDGGQLQLSESDINLLAKLVYAESRGEPFQGKVAVVSVVLNRATNPSFPHSIQGVVFERNAFSCVVNGDIPRAYPDQECYDAVYEAIKGNDPTNKALYFYNPSISTCSWMKGREKVNPTAIGQHLFFRVE